MLSSRTIARLKKLATVQENDDCRSKNVLTKLLIVVLTSLEAVDLRK